GAPARWWRGGGGGGGAGTWAGRARGGRARGPRQGDGGGAGAGGPPGPATIAVSWNRRAAPNATSSESPVLAQCTQLPTAAGRAPGPATMSGGSQPGGGSSGSGNNGSASCPRRATNALMLFTAVSATAHIGILQPFPDSGATYPTWHPVKPTHDPQGPYCTVQDKASGSWE